MITLPPIPGIPGLPNTPGVPTGPNTPGVPTGPNTPDVPTGPNTPDVPTGPNTPDVPTGPGTQITEVPRGGVDTGDGSTTGSRSSAEWSLLLLSITALGAGAAVITRRTRGHRV
ncbi:hypothetical protein [Rhodococcus sp. UNC23MFCrub1.1]|uniref:hypothetical protein n=1 Tax=Rhodococcus sp. UNC23MFCrub1.1 TaxID=1449068 RepID=UPI001E5538C8|nr:hypothetical protein [Rhodococcus sp. UNC23MFCrub1.1]